MTFALLFWLLMLFWFFFGIAPTWPRNVPEGQRRSYYGFGGSLLLFVLLGLLGWHAFGSPLHP